jgi:hypothetical protein
MNRDFIKSVVVDTIRSLMRNRDLIVDESDPVLFRTWWYGNDFGNLLILEIEEALKIRTPTKEWSKVYTVGEAIDLVVRACESRAREIR